MNKKEYSNLTLICMTPEQNKRSCNYWYAVEERTTAYKAFREAAHLHQWLEEHGLSLSHPLPPERGTWALQKIIGSFREICYFDAVDSFLQIQPAYKIAQLCNGDYTLGKVTRDENGICTVHYLNPNIRERIIFLHRAVDNREDWTRELIANSDDIQIGPRLDYSRDDWWKHPYNFFTGE